MTKLTVRDLYMLPEFQRDVSDFVGREVLACASGLIYAMAGAYGPNMDEEDQEEIRDVSIQYRYTHVADFGHIVEHEIETDDAIDTYEFHLVWERTYDDKLEGDPSFDTYQDMPPAEAFAELIDDMRTAEVPLNHQFQIVTAVKVMGEIDSEDVTATETDPYEAYEHWIVSDWLASYLEDHEEMIGRVCNVMIWGRCATGQAISMDGVIERIYLENCVNEERMAQYRNLLTIKQAA